MSDLLEDRYLPEGDPAVGGLVPARDELLEGEVDLAVLPPIADPLERARRMREFRQALRHTGSGVAHVEDTGTHQDTPFLVLPANTRPGERSGLSAGAAARAGLEILDGLDALRAAGLSWFSVLPEHLRSDESGRFQVVPVPGSAEPAGDSEVVTAAGTLLARLLPDGAGPGLAEIAARATGAAQPPVHSVSELRALLGGHMTEVSDPAPAAKAPAVVATEPKAAAKSAAPARQRHPVTHSVPEPGEVRVPVINSAAGESVTDPAYAPTFVSLSSLMPSESEYVPLSALMRDSREPLDEPLPARSGSRGRGLFHRRHRGPGTGGAEPAHSTE